MVKRPHSAWEVQNKLQFSVAGAQHRGETGRLFFAATAFAGLLIVAMIAHFLEDAFAVDFLFQPAQGLVHGLTFFQSYFSQLNSLPFYAYPGGSRSGCLRAVESKFA